MLEGVVYFKDGHTENILLSKTYPNRSTGLTDINFLTVSGEYRYRTYADEVKYGFKIARHIFEKYDDSDGKYYPAEITCIQIGGRAK